MELEVKNTGNLDIQMLKLEVSWQNKQGKLLGTETHYINSTSTPKLRRGKVRISGRTFGIENVTAKDIAKYTITVTDIQ